jgi:hypothetical protein
VTPTRTPSVERPWLVGFGVVAVAQLACVALALPPAAFLTWLLAPPLAVWAWRARGPGLLVLALALCWVGDVLGNPRLIGLGPAALYLGIAAFAAAHALLITVFVRRGGAVSPGTTTSGRRRRRALVAVPYLVAAALALAAVRGGLDPLLRAVASLYLLLIATTATTAVRLGSRVGVGAGSLFASHLLVALEVGGRLSGSSTAFRLAALSLYVAGLFLITVGVVDRLTAGRRPFRRRAVSR